MNASIALVVSDVDGTLLTPAHQITEHAQSAVRRLDESGVGFTVASSRPPRGLIQIVERLAIKLPFAPFNGALIVSPDGTIVAKHLIPTPLIRGVCDLSRRFDLNLWVYQDWDWFAWRRDEFVDREEATAEFSAQVDERLESHFQNCPKLTVVGSPEIVRQCRQEVLQQWGSELEATCSQPRFLDITIKSANKGAVITNLSRILHIPAEQIAAIGDGPNDVGMFARAGLSIAMGNAEECVQKSAKFVTTANTDEGFARGIESFVLEQQLST